MKANYKYIVAFGIALLGFVQLSQAQSKNQNYILTKTMTDNSGTKSREVVEYYDGLGRPCETVQKQFTPGRFDLVSRQEYDAFGRESKVWLPSPSSNTNGAYNGSSTASSKYGDNNPYSEITYEASPLNRIDKQYGPGQVWRNNDRKIKTEYLSNNSAYPCGYFYVSGNNLVRSGNYEDNTLYVTKMINEDNHVSYEFKDKLGRVVLQRQINGSGVEGYHDTYYVYDDFGNLSFVLPPLASDALTANSTYSETTTSVKNYAYLYRYDSRNRCVEKKLPGVDWQYMVYDRSDRLILFQDGVLRKEGKWKYSIYDPLGRLIFLGVKPLGTSTTRSQLETKYEKDLIVERFSDSGMYNYTSTSELKAEYYELIQINFYDRYDWNYSSSLVFQAIKGYDSEYASPKGLLTCSVSKMIGNLSDEVASTFYYDYKGNLIQQCSRNLLNGFDYMYISYNFTNQPINKLLAHSASNQPSIQEKYTYGYDDAGRLKTTTYQLNNEAAITLSEYAYNEFGQVASKKLPGNIENTAYTYNVRGWLEKQSGGKFTQQYFYTSCPRSDVTLSYSGNIIALQWKTSQSPVIQDQFFGYDPLGRIVSSVSAEGEFMEDNINRHSEFMAYDKHGNFKSLIRYAPLDNNSYGNVDIVDFQTYEGNQPVCIYDYAGEQLRSDVMEFRNGLWSGIRYTYDANGNMTSDLNKYLLRIDYNLLNLPRRVEHKDGHWMESYYDVSGVKHRTKHYLNTSPSSTTTTDYIGNKVYVNGVLNKILTEEGYVAKEGGVYKYYYFLKDHLGSNRMVLNSTGGVTQATDYEAFGASYLETLPSAGQVTQPYKYNGKELDRMFGMEWYDYGARMYHPTMGRFMTMDPLAEKYYSISPYAYCKNNPINRIDPDGMDDYYLNEDGRMVLARRTEDKFDNLYGKDGNNIRVNDRGLLSQLSRSTGKENRVAAETANSGDAFNVFKFATDNSNVEWSLGGYKNESGKTDYVLNTNFSEDGVKLNTMGRDALDMTFHVHSHPGGDKTKMASGYDLYQNNLSRTDDSSDADFMNARFSTAKEAGKSWPSEYPKLYMYHKTSGGLYHYNHRTNSEYVGNVSTPAIMKTLIKNHKMK